MKKQKAERDIENLAMGTMAPAAFLTAWDKLLLCYVDAFGTEPNDDWLYRQFLYKLPGDIRKNLLTKLYSEEGIPTKQKQ